MVLIALAMVLALVLVIAYANDKYVCERTGEPSGYIVGDYLIIRPCEPAGAMPKIGSPGASGHDLAKKFQF